ncbi:MAG: cytochrome c, partial [Rhodospirillales bacterium]|nr:cytochrome c [Acetobacter sp.]
MSSFAKRVRFRTVASAVPLALFVLGGSAAELPDAPGHDTVKKVCSACHPAEIVLGQGMNREQWGNLVSNMIGRGAKGTDAEFSEIVEYLATNLPGKSGTDSPAKSSAVTQKKPRGGGLLAQAGAADKQVVDEESAGRGKTVYIA